MFLPTPDPARRSRNHSTALHKACPYMVIVGSILNEDAPAPPLSYLGTSMLFIYDFTNIQIYFW